MLALWISPQMCCLHIAVASDEVGAAVASFVPDQRQEHGAVLPIRGQNRPANGARHPTAAGATPNVSSNAGFSDRTPARSGSTDPDRLRIDVDVVGPRSSSIA
jgi:hypothetical protein